jgi:integrase/recombinase XerD
MAASALTEEHRERAEGALFLPLHNRVAGHNRHAITPDSVHHEIVKKYIDHLGIKGEKMSLYVLRATSATNALDNGADITKLQDWLGHANISASKIYER